MSRILILSWDGGGNTPAAYNLGSRLARAGHRVRMMGWHAMAARAAEAGLEFTTYPSVPPWPADVRHEDGWQRIELALFGPDVEQDIVTEARTFGADLLATDCMLTAGYAAALRLHVPVVSLVHPLYAPFVHQWGNQILGTDVAELLGRSAAVLALQPPGFDLPGTLPDNTTYVGAISPPGPVRRLDATLAALLEEAGDPWVLLSMSTTLQGQREALPGLLKELASSPVRVLVTLGGVLAPESLDAPANVTVRGYLPHESVLPHVEAVITHAGMSTVATVLAAGRPLVCVPQGREQPLNAARVAEVGAGLDVTPDAVSIDLAAAVLTVLSNPRFRSTAQEFGAHSAELGFGQRAADLVESALTAEAT
jgi:UDP:flavonoid glycosyltransferase YjiC (YdhE family)